MTSKSPTRTREIFIVDLFTGALGLYLAALEAKHDGEVHIPNRMCEIHM